MNPQTNKTLSLPLRISLSLLLVGILAHVLHWQYSNYIVVLAFSSLMILYTFRFLYKQPKENLDIVKLVLVISWSFNGIWTLLHLPYKLPFQIITVISFVAWYFMEGFAYFQNIEQSQYNTKAKVVSKSLFRLAIAQIIVGVLFKIMHWPYSNIFLICGVGFLIVWLIGDYYLKKK